MLLEILPYNNLYISLLFTLQVIGTMFVTEKNPSSILILFNCCCHFVIMVRCNLYL